MTKYPWKRPTEGGQLSLSDRRKLLRPTYLQTALTRCYASVDQDPLTPPADKARLKVVLTHAILQEARLTRQEALVAYNRIPAEEIQEAEHVLFILERSPGYGPSILGKILNDEPITLPPISVPPFPVPIERSPDPRTTETSPKHLRRKTLTEIIHEETVRPGQSTTPRSQGPVHEDPRTTTSTKADNATGTAAVPELVSESPGDPGHWGGRRDRLRELQPMDRDPVQPGDRSEEVRGSPASVSVRVESKGSPRPLARRQMASGPDGSPGPGMERGRATETSRELAKPIDRWGKTLAGDLPMEIGQKTPIWRSTDGIPDLRALIRTIEYEHNGSFTVDLDFDPTKGGGGLSKPSWYHREPTRNELMLWIHRTLGDRLMSHLKLSRLEFRYSASGDGCHLRGFARTRDGPRDEWRPLDGSDTFFLRFKLGDDRARLFYDIERSDPQGWLSTINRHSDTGADGVVTWKWKESSSWSTGAKEGPKP